MPPARVRLDAARKRAKSCSDSERNDIILFDDWDKVLDIFKKMKRIEG